MSKWIVPSPEQSEQVLVVHLDLIEVINNALREGIDARVALAALASAACDTATSIFGPGAVVPWFEKQAEVARSMQHGSH